MSNEILLRLHHSLLLSSISESSTRWSSGRDANIFFPTSISIASCFFPNQYRNPGPSPILALGPNPSPNPDPNYNPNPNPTINPLFTSFYFLRNGYTDRNWLLLIPRVKGVQLKEWLLTLGAQDEESETPPISKPVCTISLPENLTCLSKCQQLFSLDFRQ
jgi:hypothetical protein